MTTLQEARELVEHGAAYLDQELPGWEAYIDRGSLDMRNGHLCLLGQLFETAPAFAEAATSWHYSPYLCAVRWLTPSLDSAARDAWGYAHGFTDYADGGGSTKITYEDLQEAWIELLTQRQARFAVRPGSAPPAPSRSAEDDLKFGDDYYDRPGFDPSLGCE